MKPTFIGFINNEISLIKEVKISKIANLSSSYHEK